MRDHDFITIRGERVRHMTAQRDWRCGICGSKLVTRWAPEGWRTVCAASPEHDDQEFVHQSTWEYIEHRRLTEAAQAEDVFHHLPPELQAAITG